ncbi:MAG: NAD(P)H-dependent oxidoreductase subunit E [Planctomycetota bacterium]|nr:NAD(P)H-dependent oxidoreductase subunit E [Planctomycetota bacterium]
MGFAFDAENEKRFEAIRERYPDPAAAMLPALRLVESQAGNVSDEAVAYVAGRLNVPPAFAHGVFSFYTHYRRASDGRHVISVCRTLPCALRGSDRIVEHLRKRLKVDAGGTTPDGKFTLKETECLGACGGGPAAEIDGRCFENLTPEMLDRILDGLDRGATPEPG